MKFEEYIEKCKRTLAGYDNDKDKIAMLCMGLSGESGEVVDYLKKVLYHGKDFDRENLIKELGDLMWYSACLIDNFNISFDEILEKNIEKLKIRYPEGFCNFDESVR